MRDYRKFCRPKFTKHPKTGDIIVLLKCGETGVMSQENYEKVLKFFKVNSFVGESEDSPGNVIAINKKLGNVAIFDPETYNDVKKLFDILEIANEKYEVPPYVDLGLPSGILWAVNNLNFPYYYSWGNLEGLDVITTGIFEETYEETPANELMENIPLVNDAVNSFMGDYWRIPTKQNFEELILECTYEWTTQNNVDGYLFTSKNNSETLFIPINGIAGIDTISSTFLSRFIDKGIHIPNGLAQIQEVQGGSVKFNQLIEDGKLVDMGLPSGTLWATCNIDVSQADGFAASPYQYDCSFFSWGNIDGHNPISNNAFDYDWGNINAQNPYYENQPYGSTQGNTLTGNIPVGRDFDAARANLGVSWRMPTNAEFTELFANIKYINADGTEVDTTKEDKRVTVNGIMGLYIQSKFNGARLFFSCSGNSNGSSWVDRGSGSAYWSSTFYSSKVARRLVFSSRGVKPHVNGDRYLGFALRPVISAGITTDDDGHKLIQYRNNVSDATQIFGAGNEPSTVEEFEAWLAENVGLQEYYDYNAGSVINNNMTGIESTGFNLFNLETGKAEVIGGVQYYIDGTYTSVTSDVETITITDHLFTPSMTGELTVIGGDNTTIINISDPVRNGTYEPYSKHTIYLDVTHIYGKKNGTGELVQVWPTGMPKVNDIVDKLCIEDGAVVAKRPVGEVDLGTLNWYYDSTSGHERMYSTGLANRIVQIESNVTVNAICNKLKVVTADATYLHLVDGSIANSNYISVYSSTMGTDTTAFKTAMSGVKLYYELATPETYTDLVYMGSDYFEDNTPVTLPIDLQEDNWGVEQIIPKNTSEIKTAPPTINFIYNIGELDKGNYWTSSYKDDDEAYIMHFDENNISIEEQYRYRGTLLRGVADWVQPEERQVLIGDIICYNSEIDREAMFSYEDWLNLDNNWEFLEIYGINTYTKNTTSVGDLAIQSKNVITFINPSDWSLLSSNWNVIGIVGIESRNMPDGKVRILSVDYMDYNNPTTGNSGTGVSMMWGGSENIDIPYKTQVPYVSTDADNLVPTEYILRVGSSGCIPTDYFSAIESTTEGYGYWTGVTNNETYIGKLCPPAYLSDGSLNPNYYATEATIPGTSTVTLIANRLSDFNGESNTAKILTMCTVETPINSSENGNYPAAQCCSLYSKGELNWYLPAEGELGLVISNFSKINISRTTLGYNSYNYSNYYYWSSTPSSQSGACIVTADGGSVGSATRSSTNSYSRVLALCAF